MAPRRWTEPEGATLHWLTRGGVPIVGHYNRELRARVLDAREWRNAEPMEETPL